ncbi:MAG: tetratricopeptide repeat protein [Luteolibacter sp.]|uniref:tetratricopeptide repeat protein n=1 Tax=Luteolibacter sp. TaxID=1962973 RepID=UPI003266B75D
MNRKFLLGLMALFVGVSSAFSTPFEQANQQFSAGDFAAAAASYQKIIADQGPDPAVYYNLGNSYQSLKQYGPAILAYERARLLTPRDPDLLANLALARKAVTAFEESGINPRLETVINHLSRNEWSWLVAGSALVLCALSILCGTVDLNARRMRHLAVGFGICAGVAIATGSTALYLRRADAVRGVVLSDQAAVRLSPFEKAESLGTAGAGRIVRLGERNGDFLYVEVPGTNLHGWLASADVAAISPADLQK